MDILDKIVEAKRADVQKSKTVNPLKALEKSEYFSRQTISLERSITDGSKYGIIAEFKRQSPSKGVINRRAGIEITCTGYFNSGASAVSVLTNSEFFGGSDSDLTNARKACSGPLLRKEFIVDEYQVVESKSIGADAILLIADILSAPEMKTLSDLAVSLGMEVLFEIHDRTGIEKLPVNARIIGINSRNLGNFTINMDIPGEIIKMLPADSIKIAESGIDKVETLIKLEETGFNGFLIGELFMKEENPAEACSRFIKELKHQKNLKMNL